MEAPRTRTERHAATDRGNQASGGGPDSEVCRDAVIGSKGSEDSQETLLGPSDSELRRLDEEELMAAFKSAWKKHERRAKKDLAPLTLFRLRKKHAARENGLGDRDSGVGEWFSQIIEILQRTVNHWANEYGTAPDQMKNTSGGW